MPGLATDLDNKDFVGTTDPDSLLRVRFYEDAFRNEYQSNLQARPVFDNVIMIEICTPGSILNIINRPALQGDKIKWPREWRYFEATAKSGERATQGTPLDQWPLLNKAQAEMLRAIKFFDVEQIAGASDEQLQTIGNHAGMQPHAFRDKARAFLKVSKDSSILEQREAELKAQNEKMAEIEAKHKAEMDELRALILAQKPKRGRPPKEATP